MDGCRAGLRWLVLVSLVVALGARVEALTVGDKLPDTSKIPLVSWSQEYRPEPFNVPSLEHLLQPDGVVVLHFLSPRPPRQGAFEIWFAEELGALSKAALTTPYPCRVVPVVPFGEKGRQDAIEVMADADRDALWGKDRPAAIWWEPTFPRPGLYRTFRPGAGDDQPIATPLTFIIGPERTILAERTANQGGQLYDWLLANLPATIEPNVRNPRGEQSLTPAGPGVWPGFRRTTDHDAEAARPEQTLPHTYLAWQTYVGRTFSSPVVADGTVYVATPDGGMQALSLGNGEPLADSSYGGATWSTPAIAGPRLYCADDDGFLFSLDRAKLDKLWSVRLLNGPITASPTIAAGRIFLGGHDGALYAVDAERGDILWSMPTGGPIASSAAVSGDTVYVGSGDRRVYAADVATGRVKWSFETGGAVDSSPTLSGGKLLVGSFDGCLYALDPASGKQLWRTELGGWVHSSPAADDRTVFAATVNYPKEVTPAFYWLDPASGAVKGQFALPDAVYSSPTIWGELVLVGCRDGKLYAFDRSGQETQPQFVQETRSYLHASPVAAADTLLLASYDGKLHALRLAKPISVWTDQDIVPRWFLAALASQLHREASALVVAAAKGEAEQEHRLTSFQPLFERIKNEAASPTAQDRVLPRDVSADHPGAAAIEYALTAGLLAGYPDATFHPSEPTTRYAFSSGLAAVLANLRRPEFVWRTLKQNDLGAAQIEVKLEPLPNRRTMPEDVPEDHWAYQSLNELVENGLLPTSEDGDFGGQRLITLSGAARQWDLIAESLRVVKE